MRRVVVTGLGLVTPLADGVEATWSRILDGQSGAGPITGFDASALVTQYACEVPLGDGSDDTFNADKYLEPKEQRKVDTFILFGMAAAQQAVEDSGWMPTDNEGQERTGVLIGSGIGGLNSIANTAIMMKEKGPRRVSPFFVPGALINLISGQVSIRYGFRGPNHSVVTACSTGAHAIGDAARFARLGLPVVSDSIAGFAGPLSGVLAGLDWAAGKGASGQAKSPPLLTREEHQRRQRGGAVGRSRPGGTAGPGGAPGANGPGARGPARGQCRGAQHRDPGR